MSPSSNTYLIDENISECVVTVGSQYINHRGGIGGVIESYQELFPRFKYICSYGTTKNKLFIVLNFIKAFTKLLVLFIKDNKVKVVHIHGAAKGSVFRKYLIYKLSAFYGKKVIFHCHGSEMEVFYVNAGRFTRKIITDFFNNVDLIICLSTYWEQFFRNNFSVKDVIVLENIVENRGIIAFDKQGGDYLNLLFLGAIGKRKGIFDLIETINQNKEFFNKHVKLTVGGDGEVKKLIDKIEKYGLGDIVSFEGWVSGEKKLHLLKNTDVYILPSYNEGLPLSILESMSFGLPVISTDVGGIPEIVKTGYNGIIIKPGEYKQLFEAIKKFVDSPDLCKIYGERSLELVEPYYAVNVMKKLENIYNRLLA